MKKTPLELQEKHYSDRRKGLKWLLVLVLLLAAAAVAYGIWASFGRRNQVVNIPVTLPKNVSRQLSGYTFTRTVKGREVFTIHAARTLAYEGALTELDGVRVVIYGPGGDRQDEVTTDKCRYDNRTGALACAGRAELTIEPSSTPGGSAAQGPAGRQTVRLVTSNVAYDPQDATIRTLDPVTFTAGTTAGAADGLAYNTRSGNLVLRKDVSFVLAGGTGGSARISAGGLIYDKRIGRISLSSPVTIEQGTQKIRAEAGLVLLDSQNRVNHLALTGVQARDSGGGGEITSTAGHLDAGLNPATGRVQLISGNGGVTVDDHDVKSGALRRLSADSATLTLPPSRSPSGPRFATASGNVKLLLDPGQSSGRPAGRRLLTAPEMSLIFLPGGLLKEADTMGASQLQLLPADPRQSSQTLSAGRLQMSFDDHGQIEKISGSSSTRIMDQPSRLAARTAQGSLPAVSSADNFLATIDPATGALKGAEQTGHFAFQQGATRATAKRAVYDAASQQLNLSGNPVVWDPSGRVRALHMNIGIGRGIALALGGVQAVYFDSPVTANESPGSPPVIVLADRLTVDKSRRTALFMGNVRAWRGADRIASPVLDLDLKHHRLTSGEGVTTTLLESAAPTKPGAAARTGPGALPQTVTIRATKLQYSGLDHKAVYEGNVQMVSGATTFRSDRLEIYLTPASANPELERAVAEGSVRLTQPPARRATGQHAEYDAAAGRIVLTGGPPAINDPDRGYLTGKRLTFFIRDASLFADGGKKAQTISKRRIMKR